MQIGQNSAKIESHINGFVGDQENPNRNPPNYLDFLGCAAALSIPKNWQEAWNHPDP
jgi:hypothetical protein